MEEENTEVEVRRICKKCIYYKRPKCLEKDKFVAKLDRACECFKIKK